MNHTARLTREDRLHLAFAVGVTIIVTIFTLLLCALPSEQVSPFTSAVEVLGVLG